jgi:hypothetical protein
MYVYICDGITKQRWCLPHSDQLLIAVVIQHNHLSISGITLSLIEQVKGNFETTPRIVAEEITAAQSQADSFRDTLVRGSFYID